MDSSAFNNGFGRDISGSAVMWIGFGIPAIIAWISFGLALLLAPHLSFEPEALNWAFYGMAGWYAIMVVIFGGWMGLLLLASL